MQVTTVNSKRLVDNKPDGREDEDKDALVVLFVSGWRAKTACRVGGTGAMSLKIGGNDASGGL